MFSYPVHTIATAPEAAKPILAKLQDTFGMIPNIAGAMANSPELVKAFAGLFHQVHSGTFTEAEIQVLLLTNAVTNSCEWAVAFHTMLALKEGLTMDDASLIREGGVPGDARLGALSRFARKLIERRGHVGGDDLQAFVAAGFRQEQALEVLAVTAASTMTNHVGTIARPALEAFLQPHAWRP